jgi:hypothetical protein
MTSHPPHRNLGDLGYPCHATHHAPRRRQCLVATYDRSRVSFTKENAGCAYARCVNNGRLERFNLEKHKDNPGLIYRDILAEGQEIYAV